MKPRKMFLFLFIVGILLGSVSASFAIANPRTTASTGGGFSFVQDQFEVGFDDSLCREGQDFVVQIDPLGCSPAVVRSDLLEEQDVPVFCKLQAIKINPIIDVDAIRSIDVFSENYPEGVKTAGAYPALSALGENTRLNNLMWDEIGYAVVVLGQEPNESAMPEYVEGNLTARITYDLNNAFGLRYHRFYLPVMEDNEFERRMGQYAFFDHRAYLRAESVYDDAAQITVYSGRYQAPFGNSRQGETSLQRVGGHNLNEGETTAKIYLPGFGCYAGVQIKLEDVKIADTRAQISVNSEIFEAEKGEEFLDGKCNVRSIEKQGVNENVRVSCQTDQGNKLIELNMDPKIKLSIGGELGSYEVGEYVYESEGKNVYLAYAGTSDGTRDLEKLKIVLIAKTGGNKDTKLTDDEILAASYISKGYDESTLISVVGSSIVNLYRWTFSGDNFDEINYTKPESFKGEYVEILGFGDYENSFLTDEIEKYYEAAIEEYDLVISNFRQEKYPTDNMKTLGEEAGYSRIILAEGLKQNQDMKFYCDEFEEIFSDSGMDISRCEDVARLSNKEVSSRDVLIDGEYKRIDLERVIQPGYEEYGAEILIRGTNESGSISRKLQKNQIIYLDDGDYIKLVSVGEDTAKVEFVGKEVSVGERAVDSFVTKGETLELNELENFGSKYSFILKNVNSEKVAQVMIIPTASNAGTEAEFKFKIGIEKRAIQLSPEKTKERIDKLNDTIEKLDKIVAGMQTVVDTMQDVCLLTGAGLTAKNLVFGANGQTLARQEVMRGEGGWYAQCEKLVADENNGYNSIDSCILDKAEDIDAEVDAIQKVLKEQNNNNKKLKEEFTDKGGILQKDVFNEEGIKVKRAKEVQGELQWIKNKEFTKGNIRVKVENVIDALNYPERYELEDLDSIELYNELYQSSPEKDSYKDRLITALNSVEVNSENILKYTAASGTTSKVPGMVPGVVESSGKNGVYQGYKAPGGTKKIGDISEGTPIQSIIYKHEYYYVTLKESEAGSNQYTIVDVYSYKDEVKVDELKEKIEEEYDIFEKYDSKDYKNRYIVPMKLRYYETEPYKGTPAVVPFDEDEGWYAYIKQTTSALGNLASYEENGRINSFYLCNVGENGIADYSKGRTVDDICQMVNLQTGQPYNQFPGLRESKAASVINEAIKAINEAKDHYESGARKVTILGKSFEVGSPAINSLTTSCQDVMSPKDCQILYNVCDPVICPSSRCDFGGKYPVRDVIQSGVIGSLALCLPNFAPTGGDVYVPVCLTGVKAGLESFTSVTQSYKDCLEQSLETGETVGICDEINSIYMCEFFWRQGIPLVKVATPKILQKIEDNFKVGGEYLRLQTAFENAKDSVDFFTKNYAVNSFNAFKARDQSEVGTEVCKNFVSVAYPQGQGFLNALTESDSPAQYNGNFETIPFTTATSPPIDQYKVYYHIFAGNDRGAYYKVYLRGGGSSYYGDTSIGRNVASGYIPKGDYKSQTVDFTAPSGYKEMCIVVNNDERCGFKEVTTGFARTYVKDQYIKSQIEKTDIKSEAECVSGSSSAYSLLSLNVQEGAGDLLDPAIYNRGVTRICSSENPGSGNDPFYPGENQRWVEVGNCGDSLMKCWIDTESVDDALEFEYTANQSLETLSNKVVEDFTAAQGYLDVGSFEDNVSEIRKENNPLIKIKLIEMIEDKVFRNTHKGYLLTLKGGAFSELAFMAFNDIPEKKSGEGEDMTEGLTTVTQQPQFYSPKFTVGLEEMSSFLGSQYSYCFSFEGNRWMWSEECGLEYGDQNMNENYLIKKEIEDFPNPLTPDDSDLFVLRLKEMDYLSGMNYFLEGYDAEKNSFFNEHASYEGEKVFSIKGVEEVNGFYLFYYENKWYWSFDNRGNKIDGWKSLEDTSATQESWQDRWGLTAFRKSVGSESVKVPDKYLDLLSALKGMEFSQGAAVIFGGEKFWESVAFSGGGSSPFGDAEEKGDYEEGESCPIVPPIPEVSGITSASEKVIEAAKRIEGQVATGSDYDESGAINCYDRAVSIYMKAGVDLPFGVGCVYSENSGKKYSVSDGMEVVTGATTSSKYAVNPDSCEYKGFSEIKKLDLLKPGMLISYYWGNSNRYPNGVGHNVVFIGWNNKATRDAKLFDANGPGGTYRYFNETLSDDEHPVYIFWEPLINGQRVETAQDSQEEKYTLQTAISKANNYNDNYYSEGGEFSKFVDALYKQEVIKAVEYFNLRDDLNGKRSIVGSSELRDYLRDIQITKRFLGEEDLIGKFSGSEEENFQEANSCSDCGGEWYDANLCDEAECFALGVFVDDKCYYSGGDCKAY